MAEFALATERLELRGWRDSDVAGLHALCSDARVMQFLGPLQTRDETATIIARQQAIQAERGHCFWAVERRSDGVFLGFCGLKPGPDATPLAGRIEIGWRLAFASWGQGYAREAAAASLAWGFANLDADEIWAMTVPANTRSWGLMERLGMERRAALDFDHPALDASDPLRAHIVYAATRPA